MINVKSNYFPVFCIFGLLFLSPVLIFQSSFLDSIKFFLIILLLIFLPGLILLKQLQFERIDAILLIFLVFTSGFLYLICISLLSLLTNSSHKWFTLIFCFSIILLYIFSRNLRFPRIKSNNSTNHLILYSIILLVLLQTRFTAGENGRMTPDGLVFYGWSAGDEMNRMALATSLSVGEYPPKEYLLGRWNIRYHFLFYLALAILHRLTEIPLYLLFFQFIPSLLSVILPLSVYSVVTFFWGDRVGVSTSILLFLSGSLGYISYLPFFVNNPIKVIAQPLWWDNNFGGDSFFVRFHGGFHTLMGVLIFLYFFLLFSIALKNRDKLQRRRVLIFLGIFLSATAGIQLHTFMVIVLSILLFICLYRLGSDTSSKRLWSFITKEKIPLITFIFFSGYFILHMLILLSFRIFSASGLFNQRIFLPGLESIVKAYYISFFLLCLIVLYVSKKVAGHDLKSRFVLHSSDILTVLSIGLVLGLGISYTTLFNFDSPETEFSNNRIDFDALRLMDSFFPFDGYVEQKYFSFPKNFIELSIFRNYFISFQGIGINPGVLYQFIMFEPFLFCIFGVSSVLLYLFCNYFLKIIFASLFFKRHTSSFFLTEPENLLIASVLIVSILLPLLFNINNVQYVQYIYIPLALSIFGGMYLAKIDFTVKNRILLLILFSLSLPTLIQSPFWFIHGQTKVFVTPLELEAAKYIQDTTPPKSFVVVAPKNHPLPNFFERRTVMSHSWLYSLYADESIFSIDEQFVNDLYSGNLTKPHLKGLSTPYYVYVGPFEREVYGQNVNEVITNYPFTKLVYANSDSSFYQISY